MAWAYDPTFNFSTWVVASVLFFTICLSIYAYGFLTFAKNFYTILRNDLKKSRFWKIPALISAVWYELAGVLLLPIVIKKETLGRFAVYIAEFRVCFSWIYA